MRIVYMGTPEFAVPSLRKLAGRHEVVLCLTRPDAVRGRGKRLVPSPVKVAAEELGVPVVGTKRITPEVLEQVVAARPDVICVAAYGAILPDSVLGVAPLGCVNVHGSLLPRWRGAAPIQRAILAGDERVGVSIMRIAHELDAGAYCRQASVPVGDKTCQQIMAELAELGASELLAALDDMAAGTVTWIEQDESLVTMSPKITKQEMRLSPEDAALVNRRRVQASTDEAPARFAVDGRGVRAIEALMAPADVQLAPGGVLVRHGRVYLGCVDGAIELVRVKPDGKREMEASAWAAGLRGELAWGRIER